MHGFVNQVARSEAGSYLRSMMAPNPRSLGDNFPDDPRFLEEDAGVGSKNVDDDASQGAEPPRKTESGQDFQNPMTEEDVASGGPADPSRD